MSIIKEVQLDRFQKVGGKKLTEKTKKSSLLRDKSSLKKRKEDIKWRTLKHNGVLFPPFYESKNLNLRIRGNYLPLNSEQEEMAWEWAKKRDTPYVKDEVFISNFLSSFKKTLPKEYSNVSISEIDFSNIIKTQDHAKIKNSDPETKKRLVTARKKLRTELKERYGYAEINGTKVEVANYMVEPPGIFMGRGKHPLRGRWKKRVNPNEVTLNLSRDAPIPQVHLDNVTGKWKRIVHDRTSMWLASWVDRLTDKTKYVWLHDSSEIRQERDKVKYDKSKKLLTRLDKVRYYIRRGMSSKDEKTRRIATVCYLIDNLCMRVGDEKDEDEADTVGASTLRVEHIKLTPETIQFDFLGKDSVPWSKTISVNSEDSILFRRNLERFISNKKPNELVFDGVKSLHINKFLGSAVNGLTAKVFRTFHATNVARDKLIEQNDLKKEPEFLKIYHAKIANLLVAITCNHKRTPPKNWDESIAKKHERLVKMKSSTPKTVSAKRSLKEKILKTDISIKLSEQIRDYNLNTSLRNYIDPRVYKSWADYVDLDWRKIYPSTLQRKFSWVERTGEKWKQDKTGE